MTEGIWKTIVILPIFRNRNLPEFLLGFSWWPVSNGGFQETWCNLKKNADYRWCFTFILLRVYSATFFKAGEYLCLLLVTCHWVGLITSPFLTSKLKMLPCWIYCKSYSLLIGQEPMIHWCLRLKHLRHRFFCQEFDFNYLHMRTWFRYNVCYDFLQWFEIRIMNWIRL